MTDSSLNELMRQLPQVEEVLNSEPVRVAEACAGHTIAAEAAREVLAQTRTALLAGDITELSKPALFEEVAARAYAKARPSLHPVINATGVVIHTNLGRSPLALSAIRAVAEVAGNYSTLEYDTEAMGRGSRHTHIEQLICALTGAEAAMAVNNNAAAVMMVLNEFARGKEAVVSRGEEVEIGGSFRIPDIMQMSGAHMVEIGTTNKTHAEDYRRAINDRTAMLLKVHTSNFRVVGFTESVPREDIRSIADKENSRRSAAAAGAEFDELLVYEDLGSGAFIDLPIFEQFGEITVNFALRAGMDLVSFSGDKLLGGPQAGIIAGKKSFIDRLKKNPLARALRLDKMTLAALEATLRLYLDPWRALAEIPTLHMLTEDKASITQRAEMLRDAVADAIPSGVTVGLADDVSRVGGGSLPLCELPTSCVSFDFKAGCGWSAEACQAALIQRHEPSVVGRVQRGRLLLDLRTITLAEVPVVAEAVRSLFAGEAD